MGGPLKFSIACALQSDIAIYDLIASSSNVAANSKAIWNGHESSPVCLLRKNPFGISLLSSSWNGSIHFWDLKNKPTTPAIKFLKHTRAVTGTEMVNEFNMISSSADANMFLWDLRNSSVPVRSIIPDGKSILNLKLNNVTNKVTIATLKVFLYWYKSNVS
jgi:WD40 repeat protein